MTRRTVVIGTRGSALAMWQARFAKASLESAFPDTRFDLRQVHTRGDVDHSSPLADMGTAGIFVKEIETALLAGEIDVAVHSLKDLPSDLQLGLTLAAYGPREDPRDALVSREGMPLARLRSGARVGTSSPRRAAQISALRSDLIVENIRGNVETRVRKVMEGGYDASVLAAAGLLRLGLEDRIAEYFAPSVLLPAPGQGIVALEVRAEDREMREMVGRVDDAEARVAAMAERAFVRALGGGCTTPLAALARVDGSTIRMAALLASRDGRRLIRREAVGETSAPEEVGEGLARRVLADGGREMLAEIERAGGIPSGE